MNWLSNISIRARLWILTSVLTLIMILISLFGMQASKNIQNHLVEMYEDPLSHTRNVGRAISAMTQRLWTESPIQESYYLYQHLKDYGDVPNIHSPFRQ